MLAITYQFKFSYCFTPSPSLLGFAVLVNNYLVLLEGKNPASTIWSHLSLCSCWPALFTAPRQEPCAPAHHLWSTSPATHPSCQGLLPSARAPSRPSRFYEVPDEPDSIKVAWKATPQQMRGDRELREEQGDTAGLLLHMAKGVELPVSKRYREERERIWRIETLRKLFPPCHWNGKLEANPWVLLGSSVIKCFAYTSSRAHLGENHLAGGWGMPTGPSRRLCPKQLQEWAPSAGGNKDSAKCGELQVSATTCKSPTCGP